MSVVGGPSICRYPGLLPKATTYNSTVPTEDIESIASVVRTEASDVTVTLRSLGCLALDPLFGPRGRIRTTILLLFGLTVWSRIISLLPFFGSKGLKRRVGQE
jgi:hypothetical protein